MPENRRILEWISLKDAPNGVIPNSDEIFAVLQEIQKLQECTGVARGRPQELRNIEWLIIEWRGSRDREEFCTSELYLRLEEALATRSWSREVSCLLPDRGHIIAAHPMSPPMLYEVLTIYFPVDLDPATISSLEKFSVLPRWHIDGEDPVEYPSAALKAQTPVMWKEGTCEYQGQTARRFVYFIKFVNEEGERIYKEKVRYDPGGRTPLDIMSYFFGQLEDLGMIGYEPRHVEFVEIVHYVPENYVSEPLPTQLMECPPHNIADLEGDCDDL
ncbi:hypothetical protein N7536_002229 [Penicillium majusculum]|nr:hypothetical protein N7536_002229 [Penicillium majusculum]